ncbi:MAG: hypothetical protein MZV64_13215 [Ignavibacteriales bacterium]|nr:hypothetical protein [Ignavibacteriales bacterium]
MEPEAPVLVVVLGPTAVGKSRVAVDLALRFGGEIIGGDSIQVYRGFDIGTDKPSPAERRGVPHHLIDVVEPTVQFTAADFVREALAAARDIAARGRLPIVAGGTGLYLKALRRRALPRSRPRPGRAGGPRGRGPREGPRSPLPIGSKPSIRPMPRRSGTATGSGSSGPSRSTRRPAGPSPSTSSATASPVAGPPGRAPRPAPRPGRPSSGASRSGSSGCSPGASSRRSAACSRGASRDDAPPFRALGYRHVRPATSRGGLALEEAVGPDQDRHAPVRQAPDDLVPQDGRRRLVLPGRRPGP